MRDVPSLELRARAGLRRRRLSADSIAVFDTRSWRTHIVGGAAAMLLTLLDGRGVHPLESLVDALGFAESGFRDDEARALVDKAICELQACDLIELVDAGRACMQ